MPVIQTATATLKYTYAELTTDAGLSDVVVASANHKVADQRLELTFTNATPPTDTPGVSDPDATAATYSWTGDDLASLAGLGWGATNITQVDYDTSSSPVDKLIVKLTKA